MTPDFWQLHGALFLFGIVLFPRITLLVSSVATGGFFWWLGWLFAPRLLVAILALPFWHNNPVLVAVAWLLVLVDFLEKDAMKKKSSFLSPNQQKEEKHVV